MAGPKFILAVSFLIAALFFVPVSAGDITFQTPYSSYTFQTGEEAKIQVLVNNGIEKDIKGTLIGKFTASSDGINPLTSSYSKQQAFNVYSDMESFSYIIGTENEPKTIYADIIFEFTADRVYRINLPGIKITFTDSPVDEQSTGDSISATQDETITNTDRLREQNANSAAPRENPAQTEDLSTGVNRENADTEALKESTEKEIQKIKELKSSLLTTILTDQLFAGINDSLYSQNFRDGIISVMPKDMDSGAFSLEYRSKNADIVMVSGELEEGRISYIRQESNFSIELPLILLQNETFKEFTGLLRDKKYEKVFSAINYTQEGSEFEISYESGLNPAIINAVIQKDNLTEVTLIRDSGIPLYAAAILIIITAGVIAAASYYGLLRKPENNDSKIKISPLSDDSESPQDMLKVAVLMYNRGQKKEAFHKVSQSLRQFISEKYGTGDEITDRQCLKLTLKDETVNEKCKMILSKTYPVRFAGESDLTVTSEDFFEIVESVEGIIGNFQKYIE